MTTTTEKIQRFSYKGKLKGNNKNQNVFGAHMGLQEAATLTNADMPKVNKYQFKDTTSRMKGELSDWYGEEVNSLSDAEKLVAEGWREGADKALAMVEEVYANCKLPEPKDVRRQQVWADDGDDLDYDRLMSGEIETMWRTTKSNGKGFNPHATLMVSWGGNANISAEALFWSGAVAIILSDLLEDSGYRTEIVGGMGGFHRATKQYTISSVCVKELNEPLRTDAVAGALCSAGVFRTVGFKAILAADTEIDSSLGSNVSLEKMPAGLIHEATPYTDNMFIIKQCLNKEDAIAEINRVCEELDSK